MPGYEDAKNMEKSDNEIRRLHRERIRKQKYNPDGTLRRIEVNDNG